MLTSIFLALLNYSFHLFLCFHFAIWYAKAFVTWRTFFIFIHFTFINVKHHQYCAFADPLETKSMVVWGKKSCYTFALLMNKRIFQLKKKQILNTQSRGKENQGWGTFNFSSKSSENLQCLSQGRIISKWLRICRLRHFQ